MATSWTALIALTVATLLVIVLAVSAVVRRSPYGSRSGRILSSILMCPAYFVPATLLFERADSGSAGYRAHIGEEAFATTWDVLLLIGSAWLAFVVGWLAARLLGGRSPLEWPRRAASVRDAGLIALLVSGVALLFASTTGPHLRSLGSFTLNAWGVWGLSQSLPLARLLIRRLRAATTPAADNDSRIDRLARPFLAGYYWFAAIGVPYTVWGLSRVNQLLQA